MTQSAQAPETAPTPERPSYRVTKLQSGTVIDHIAPGRALEVVRHLAVDPRQTAAIGMNFPSGKHSSKDIIKFENRDLTQDEISMISLVAPQATISVIRDFKVVDKRKSEVAREVLGILTCPSSSCISNHEQGVTTRFVVMRPEPLLLHCHYCERTFGRDQLLIRQ